MTTQETTIQTLAAEVAAQERTARRLNGEVFVKLAEDAPEWMSGLMYAAHHGVTDFLPDDYRYQFAFAACQWISESEGADDFADTVAEFTNSQVADYDSDRIRWLASHSFRTYFVDEASAEYGDQGGIIGLIGLGMYSEAQEVFWLVVTALAEQLES